MLRGLTIQTGLTLLALCWLGSLAHADPMFGDLTISAYGDFRAVDSPSEAAWLNGGLSKFRYGGNDGNFRAAEGVAELDLKLSDDISAVTVLRAEPEQRTGVDALEGYFAWRPSASGSWSWSVKTGAFFPNISLENDDLGWTSPYTLTPSAINSWVGEELRTIGSEAILKYDTGVIGSFAATGSVFCCNDPAEILMADRGWAMDDRPSGLFSDVREPDATLKLFGETPPDRTPLFDEIDGRPGWYAGLSWQMPEVGKLSVLRYDNEGNPDKVSGEYAAWDTRFWSYGARTQWDELVLIAQGLQGRTVIGTPFGLAYTGFQSAFLLASYDLTELGLSDWRISARGDVFQTRHPGFSVLDEDGDAATLAVIWQGYDWLRVTGEMIAMQSRKDEYLLAGFPASRVTQEEFQLSVRFFWSSLDETAAL